MTMSMNHVAMATKTMVYCSLSFAVDDNIYQSTFIIVYILNNIKSIILYITD